MLYDPARFVDGEFAWCAVSVTLRGGEVRVAVGDYLHYDALDGAVRLMCGIYDLCAALGLPDPPDEKCLAVSAVVDRQLSRRPWAVLLCDELSARIELVEPPR